MTPTQCGGVGTRNITVAGTGWVAALEAAGWDVEQRVVTVTEDLSKFDAVLVGIGQLNSMTARHANGCLYTLHRRPDAKLYVDDWQITQAHSGFRVSKYSPSRIWLMDGRPGSFTVLQDPQLQADWQEVLNEFAAPRWKRPTLVATHGAGVPHLLKVPGPVVTADPTNLTRRFETARTKEKRWIWASLYLHGSAKKAPWTGTWPITFRGRAKDLPPGTGITEDGAFCTQEELIDEMQDAWGFIVPHRPLMGSGWWRGRYALARDAGCAVYCPPAEGALFGDAYLAKPEEIEADPKMWADAQRVAFDQKTWSKEHCVEVVDEFMRG